jgi:hypothetical protein
MTNFTHARRRLSVSRRRFLRRGVPGALAAAAGAWAERAWLQGAEPARNPFAYDLGRYRRIDPTLIRYERVRRFRCPRPEPRRIALGPQNRLYLAAGKYVTALDGEGARLTELACTGPVRCLGVTGEGTLYAGLRDRVEVYDLQGNRQAQWDRLAGKPFLTGIAVGANDLFAADAGNRVVHRYDRSGRSIRRIGERDTAHDIAGFVVPSPFLDVEIAPDGLLRVNNPGRHRVEAYTFDGDLEFAWGRPSAAIDGFIGCCNPVNLALLPDGRCVTFEKGLPRVKIYRADGTFESVVAGPDLFADTGREPAIMEADESTSGGLDGVADAAGRVYVLDLVGGEIHVMQPKA